VAGTATRKAGGERLARPVRPSLPLIALGRELLPLLCRELPLAGAISDQRGRIQALLARAVYRRLREETWTDHDCDVDAMLVPIRGRSPIVPAETSQVLAVVFR
jgi:hypothetical protein